MVMVRPISFSVVASTLVPLIPIHHTIATSVDIASSVRLAQETYHQLVVALRVEALAKEDEETGKHNQNHINSAEESTTDTASLYPTNSDIEHAEEEDKNLTYDGSDLIAWINDNGGLVHANARIGLDPTGQYRGVFVKNVGQEGGTSDGIKEGDIIGRIPWDLIIKPNNYHPHIYESCEALHELHHQFLLGDESPHAPYVNYLKNQPRGRNPEEWTAAGKGLLKNILNHETLFEEPTGVGLPPGGFQLKEYQEFWMEECGGADTELARAAYFQFISRDEDTLMVPFYDLLSHSNDPEKLNTISDKPERRGRPFLLHSTRDIVPGEQIFNTYNRCNRCWFDPKYKGCDTWSYYGTSELFFYFGFVEDYPQTWDYRMKSDGYKSDNLVFHLTKTADGQLTVSFGDNYSRDPEAEKPLASDITYMGEQLVRLAELELSMEEDDALKQTIPKHEWEMAWKYHEALMISLSAAILASRFAEAVVHTEDRKHAGYSIDEDSKDDSSDSEDSEDDSDDDSVDSGDDEDGSDDDSGDNKVEEVRDDL